MKNMTCIRHGVTMLFFLVSSALTAQNVYYIYSDTIGGAEPWTWSPPPFNSDVMDSVFGPEGTGWIREYFETLDPESVFSASTCTVYLEGGDSHDIPLNTFLAANLPLIESWVFDGGHLLICSAPNYFGPINCGFGGVQIIWPRYAWTATTVNPLHPIFQGPYSTGDNIWDGTYFSHANLTGGTLTPLLIDSLDGDTVLAESSWGAGKLLFATITVPGWHTPAPDGFNLRANILTYLACDVCVAETPTGLYADHITTTKARLHWDAIDEVDKYKVYVYTTGEALVTKKNTTTNFLNVKELTPGTTYIFKVKSVCSETGEMSAFSTPGSFTTLLRMGELDETVNVYPNPASNQINITGITGNDITIQLVNSVGQMIYSKQNIALAGDATETIELSDISSGIYIVMIQNGEKMYRQKLIIE